MTLQKNFTLAAKNFKSFDTMPFEAAAYAIPSLSGQEEQVQHHHPTGQNPQQQQSPILSTLNPIHSTLSPITTSSNIITAENNNNTMFDVVTDPNVNGNFSSRQEMLSNNHESQQLLESVMPGIYLTKDFISWNEEKLRAHGFTHIIIIDKHIQELYYPNEQPDVFKLCSMNKESDHFSHSMGHDTTGSSLNAFEYYCPPSLPPTSTTANHLSFGKEFKVIDLNFGEKSYLTTVLPNCYKAVKFINKALLVDGTILVIDCNGAEQKCLTIIVAYLMYKNNISFRDAFARLKDCYKKADLDRFYVSQLYEYEPILQVQRAQSRGHSCSRKIHAAMLKRKKTNDDEDLPAASYYPLADLSSSANATSATELFNNCNPLNRFDSAQMKRQEINSPPEQSNVMSQDNCNVSRCTRFMSDASSSSSSSSSAVCGWYNFDDNVMEWNK